MNIDDGKLEDIDDMGEENKLHLNANIPNEENQGNHLSADHNKGQQNNYGTNLDDDQDKHLDNDMDKD